MTCASVSNFKAILTVVALTLLATGATIASAQAQVIEVFDEVLDGEDLEQREQEDDEDEESGEDVDEEEAALRIIGSDGTGLTSQGAPTRTTRLEYERKGQSILVPARVGRHDAYFIFDTGASYSTLTSDFARTAGVYPDEDAPQTQVQTAGGIQSTKFGLISRFRLGRQTIENVSFTICDACGGVEHQGRPLVGLLGLNILRRYRVSVDDSRGVIELEPHSDFDERAADIEPWLESGLVEVDSDKLVVQVKNRAPQAIAAAVIEVRCITLGGGQKTETARTGRVRAGGTAKLRLDGDMISCQMMDATVTEGSW